MVWGTLSNDCLVPIDGMGGLPWYGERYHNDCIVRSMGWADCHGMGNVITMIALSDRWDGRTAMVWGTLSQ